jgi:hypothetical protein
VYAESDISGELEIMDLTATFVRRSSVLVHDDGSRFTHFIIRVPRWSGDGYILSI